MQLNLPFSSLDSSQIRILESLDFLLFLRRYPVYFKIYPYFIKILKDFSHLEILPDLCLSLLSIFAKYPTIMKIFSFYLPYSLSKCLYISSLNSCHSLFSLDALSNQLDYSSIPQAYYFINMKTCTIFRNDMYIFLKLLYSSLSKWDSYSTDVIVNWKDIFYQISRWPYFSSHDLSFFLFRRNIYFELSGRFKEICNSPVPYYMTPILNENDFSYTTLFLLHCIQSIFDCNFVFKNFLKTHICNITKFTRTSSNSFLSESPQLLQLAKDLYCNSSDFKQTLDTLTGISFPSASFRDISRIHSNISGVSYRSSHSPFPLSQSSGFVEYFSKQTLLNENFIQYPNTSDDHSFYCSRLLPADEAILKCEEERYELDIVIETAQYTIDCLERILYYKSYNGVEQGFCVYFHHQLKTISLSILKSTIFRIYGERCEAIILSMLNYPTIIVPIILFRLNERIQEWKDAQIQFNKVWRENIHRSYTKGVDISSLSFLYANIRTIKSRTSFREIDLLQENACHQSNQLFLNSFPLKLEIDFSCIVDVNNLLFCIVLQHAASQSIDISKLQSFLCFIESFFSNFYPWTPKSMQFNSKHTLFDFSYFLDIPNLHNQIYFICNTCWYIFLRSYQIFISLLSQLKMCCLKLCDFLLSKRTSKCILKDFKAKNAFLRKINVVYTKSLDLLHSLIHSKVCSFSFEESSKDILGIYFYTLVTLEKILPILSKHAISLMNDKSFYGIIAQGDHFVNSELIKRRIFDQSSAFINCESFYQIVLDCKTPGFIIYRFVFNLPLDNVVVNRSVGDKQGVYLSILLRSNMNSLFLIRNLQQIVGISSPILLISERYHRFLDVNSKYVLCETECFYFSQFKVKDIISRRSKILKNSRRHKFLCLL